MTIQKTFGASAEHVNKGQNAPKRGVIYDDDLTAAERRGLSDRQPTIVQPPRTGEAFAFSQATAARKAEIFAELEKPTPQESAGEIAVAGTVRVEPGGGEWKRDRVALRRPKSKESI